MIDDHDYDVKMRSMKRFFEEGDKVKITLRFRGREMAHQELGIKLLNRVKEDTGPYRQGRIGAALRRPPDGHDAGAALRRRRRSGDPEFDDAPRAITAGGAFVLGQHSYKPLIICIIFRNAPGARLRWRSGRCRLSIRPRAC